MGESLKIEAESTLTDRFQTTVPETVRRALRLRKRDKLHFTILPSGDVLLSKASPTAEVDPVLDRFLEFVEHDMQRRPESLRAVDASLVERISTLVGDCAVDLDAALPDEDE
jgi:antitoxin PrlF